MEVTYSLLTPPFGSSSAGVVRVVLPSADDPEVVAMSGTRMSAAVPPVHIRAGGGLENCCDDSSRVSGIVVAGGSAAAPKASTRRGLRRCNVRRIMRAGLVCIRLRFGVRRRLKLMD